jgi:PAS domain S-box-containing protein
MTEEEILRAGRAGLEDPSDPVPSSAFDERARTGMVRFETTHVRKDGSRVPTEVTSVLVDGGRRSIVFIRDITGRRQAEKALRESELALRSAEDTLKRSQAQLRMFVKYAPLGVAMFDRDMNYLAVSDRWLLEHGQVGEDLTGRNHYDVHPDVPDEWKRVHREALAGRSAVREDDLWVHADGGRCWLRWAALPWLDETGRIGGIIISSEDITERKTTEDAIHSSKRLLQSVIDSTPDWIHVKDRNYRMIMVNQSLADALGRAPEEIIGRIDAEAVAPVLGGDVEAQIARMHERDVRAFAGEFVHEEHEEMISARGEVRIFDTFKGPLRDAANEVYAVLTVRRDVTERRRNEEGQRALEAQLRQAQKMEVIGHLTGGIAHDFNNILTAIFGFAELALLSPVAARDASLSRYLQRIVEAAARARDLVQQLLTFSHKRGPTNESSSVAPIIKEVTKLLRSTTPSTISITTEIAAGLPEALVSPIQLHQILMNLGINARDAIGEKGAIDIRAEMAHFADAAVCASCHRSFAGDYVAIVLADTGSGIAAADLPNIFDPFFSTKETGQGTGLGLSVLHGIVHSANGHVAVTTRVGAGTEFRVYLPFRPGAIQQSSHEQPQVGAGARVSGRVMVVDDEPDILDFMTTLLEGIGCKVSPIASATAAWSAFCDAPHDFDLIITDQTMPDMTGADLARAVLACRPELPIVLSTGYSAAIDEEVVREIGVRRLLRKPVPARVLCEMVAQYLQGGSSGPG